jgi:hypothetical protein
VSAAVRRLDLTIGELVEVAGRRYEVVPDREGGVTIEPQITPVAELHARRGPRCSSPRESRSLTAGRISDGENLESRREVA